ncbi:MAG TPA: SAM-dependent chlorinase/fluorinase [Candidatus Sulfomarinibacteraceae bacterium]|nr:SAM-dependent chlorinase/fluorinase [Candidatus Sulfomarinibacteraceae bacterium]
MDRPVISFLTDFGPESAPAICRGVMLSIARDAQIIDISHGVRKFAIGDGAYLLWSAVPWLPVGVHVTVVDPGVGTTRLPIGLRVARGDILIGPDNGVLMPAAAALGGITEARILDNQAMMLPRTTSTFHGRDVFAPMAGHLATGRAFEEVGPSIAPANLVALEFPAPVEVDGGLDTTVLFVDSFGNVRLAGERADLEAAIGPLTPGRALSVEFAPHEGRPAIAQVMPWARTFGERPPGAPLVYENSFGQLAIADNQGDAAARLDITAGRSVRVRPT